MYVDITGSAAGSGATPGKGARVKSFFSVTPGATLYINVGCQGTNSAGGWNGGGYPYGEGSGGGGATDIRVGGTSLSNRIVVAGGGGGAYWGTDCGQKKGGDGGQYGTEGNLANSCNSGARATGGTWSGGGGAGLSAGSPQATPGSLGVGGNGGRVNAGGGGREGSRPCRG